MKNAWRRIALPVVAMLLCSVQAQGAACEIAILGGLAVHDKTVMTTVVDPALLVAGHAVDGIANTWTVDSGGVRVNASGTSERVADVLIFDATGTGGCFNYPNTITLAFNTSMTSPSAPGTLPIANFDLYDSNYDSSGYYGLKIKDITASLAFAANTTQTIITITVDRPGTMGSVPFFPTSASSGGVAGAAIRLKDLHFDASQLPTGVSTIQLAGSQGSGNLTSVNAATFASQNVLATAVSGLSAPHLQVAFGSSSTIIGNTVPLTFALNNPNTSTTLNSISFWDALPAGLAVATPANVSGSCGGGTLTAPDGANFISLSNATLSPSTGCSVSVNVTAATAGLKSNTTQLLSSTTGWATPATNTLNVLAPPSVTINQANTQLDPAISGPIHFTVSFSEPVNGFASGGVSIGGTATFSSKNVAVSGSGSAYDVAVAGMKGFGTVIATIPAGVAVSSGTGLGNLASTSSDNTVSYGKQRRGQVVTDQ